MSGQRDPQLEAIDGAIAENIANGYMEFVGVDASGELTYRLTEEGERRAKALFEGTDSEAGND